MWSLRKSVLAVLIAASVACMAVPVAAADDLPDAAVASVDDGGAAASVPTIDPGADPGGVAKTALDKAKSGNWLALAAIVVIVICFGLRKYGPSWFDAFKTDGGGVLLTFLTAFVTLLADTVAAGLTPSMSTVKTALVVAVAAAGGYAAMKKGGVALLRIIGWKSAGDWLAKVLSVPEPAKDPAKV